MNVSRNRRETKNTAVQQWSAAAETFGSVGSPGGAAATADRREADVVPHLAAHRHSGLQPGRKPGMAEGRQCRGIEESRWRRSDDFDALDRTLIGNDQPER